MQETLSIKEIFPYSKIRVGQKELIELVENISSTGGHIVVEGCNGLGKTIGVLAGLIPSILKNDKTVLYLARTHKQIDRVMDELKVISKKVNIKGVSLRGRKEMCFNSLVNKYCPDPRSAMDVCKELQRQKKCVFYEKLITDYYIFERARKSVLENPLSTRELINICRELKICPYEFSKKMLSDVNIIAMNFLYVLSPEIRKMFLTNLNKKLNDIIIVFDEAHNIPDIALNISSDSLSKTSIRSCAKEADKYRLKDIKSFSKYLLDAFIELESLLGNYEEMLVPRYFLEEKIFRKSNYYDSNSFLEDMHNKGESIQRLMISEGQFPHSYVHRVSEFMIYWLDTIGKNDYCHIMKNYRRKEDYSYNKLEIVALDPRRITSLLYNQVFATINISGTMQPLDAFADIVGLPSKSIKRVVKSPFDRNNVLALIGEGVSTALNQRVESNYIKIIDKICEIVDVTPANIGIFTASYVVLNDLVRFGIEDKLSKKLFVENPDLTSKQNDKLIIQFKNCKNKGGAVLLGVMGGRNSEGEDFPGDEMNSVIIVGLPYAKPTPSVKASINFYDMNFPGKGREYGYTIPAMRKAAQAGGRAIRRMEDKGAIIFLDWRFKNNNCMGYLPIWIRENLELAPDTKDFLRSKIKKFFNNNY
jgi:DNA excision repair protein ERCC-2